MNEEEFAELAAGAALHALSRVDERRYRDALAAHPEWMPIVEADAEVAGLLAGAAAPSDPPAHIRSALLAQIAATPQTGELPAEEVIDAQPAEYLTTSKADLASDAPRSGGGVRRTRILFALAACLALLVGVGVGAVALNNQLNRPASVVALEQIQASDDAQRATVDLETGGTATAHWSTSLGTAVLVADGIPELAEGETYELWFVRGETPVSAGVFAAGDGDATAVLAGEMHSGDVIAVTVEQEGGSPTGQPTSDPVIVIPTA
ncbi:anti-sigma factor [Microbacterium sp. SD291]|uniref:anti-sigma factor n=1 Tax=Microbacterium sp. SD291 TaxID=2782007 RepID=UPI001A9627D0|nr:anti-sigma factor [Microbacterium sp. SD291]MBO0979956.1 anti-sigma factor [Microbacterium sp. SD291]